jgi:hypothetical protein
MIHIPRIVRGGRKDMTNEIRIINELPVRTGKQKEVEIEYRGKRYAVGSEGGISGLDDGIQEGYLEEDIILFLRGKPTENYIIRIL